MPAADKGFILSYLSVKILLYGCDDEVELEQEFPSSIMSNFRLTDPSGLGRIAIGDIDRRVANERRVGDGDIPYCKRITLWRFVGDGDEQPLLLGRETWSGLLNSSVLLQVQFSLKTSVRSS